MYYMYIYTYIYSSWKWQFECIIIELCYGKKFREPPSFERKKVAKNRYFSCVDVPLSQPIQADPALLTASGFHQQQQNRLVQQEILLVLLHPSHHQILPAQTPDHRTTVFQKRQGTWDDGWHRMTITHRWWGTAARTQRKHRSIFRNSLTSNLIVLTITGRTIQSIPPNALHHCSKIFYLFMGV